MDIVIVDNDVNLCESCVERYPECCADVFFGTGPGMDNICCCNGYKPIAKNRWAEECNSFGDTEQNVQKQAR